MGNRLRMVAAAKLELMMTPFSVMVFKKAVSCYLPTYDQKSYRDLSSSVSLWDIENFHLISDFTLFFFEGIFVSGAGFW